MLISECVTGQYCFGILGAIWTFKGKASGNGISLDEDDTENRIPLLVGVGYNLPNGLALGATLMVPNLLLRNDNEDVELGFMASVGYVIGT